MPPRLAVVLGLIALLAPTPAFAGCGEEVDLADVAMGALLAQDRAAELAKAGQKAEAVAVLAREVERTGYFAAAEALWQLHLQLGQTEEARSLVARLLARRKEPLALGAGHALAARSAVMDRDLAAAERHYRSYLAAPCPEDEVAAELLAIAAPGEEAGARRATLARELCDDGLLDAPDLDHCSSELLRMAGDHQGALDALAKFATRAPNNVHQLSQLADRAIDAKDWETAEWALRRAVALEPASPYGWTGLAQLHSARDSLAGLEALVKEARGALPRVPRGVLMVYADLLLAKRQPRRAIDALREARAGLRPDEETAWIDDKLNSAYEALGSAPP